MLSKARNNQECRSGAKIVRYLSSQHLLILHIKAVMSWKPRYHKYRCHVSPVRMLWNAVSTLVESRAEVSMKLRLFFSAKALLSSVGTALRCRRSDLLPTWSQNYKMPEM